MLTQDRADELIQMPKRCVDDSTIRFPLPGSSLRLELKSLDNRESFLVDANRKGKTRLSKCTYQERYGVIEILVRLDVGGPPHVNPDGEEVACPHVHTYREGFGDKWAEAAQPYFPHASDLVRTLSDFLRYCHVQDLPQIQRAVQ